MNYTKLLMEARRLLVDNSPLILTGLAVSGVVTTAVLAVKATPQAHRELWNAASEKNDDLSTVEVIQIVWRDYLPAALMGTATITCIIAANTVSTRRNAALAGLVSLTESSFREYKHQVIEKIGEKPEREIREAMAKNQIGRLTSDTNVIITGLGEHLCYDMFTGRYFRSDIDDIRKAENSLNAVMIQGQQYASLNEFYSFIGLEPTNQGDLVGWNSDDLLELQLSSHLSPQGEPALAIDFKNPPIERYYKGHR